jgi:hypothetical protein
MAESIILGNMGPFYRRYHLSRSPTMILIGRGIPYQQPDDLVQGQAVAPVIPRLEKGPIQSESIGD